MGHNYLADRNLIAEREGEQARDYFSRFTPAQAADAIHGLGSDDQDWIRERVNGGRTTDQLAADFFCSAEMAEALRDAVNAGA